jgi:hypothetical protein
MRCALLALLVLAAAPAHADLHAVRKLAGPAMVMVSARHAWKSYADPRKSTFEKTLDSAHAGADVVRLVFPTAGAIGGAALVGVSAGTAVVRWQQRQKHAARVRLWLRDAGVNRPQ